MKEQKEQRFFRLVYRLIWPLVQILYPVRVHHIERLPEGGAVICAPHTSMIDPVMIVMALGIRKYPRFMAKKELFEKPILRGILRGIGTVPVNRGSADIQAIKSALGILKGGGILGIFPEGTRVHGEETGSAHSGAIMLASRTGVPLVPVWMTRNKKPFRKVDVVIGEPYALPRLTGGSEVYQPYAEELMDRIGALKEDDR